ncbi:nuclear transport factor 2 family protein [Candidatus Palauibacter soopunensis]|uniref:nuclear transport factor 2 family protein n=1 Tax=Candidatus Palauibacter soopunensis TaxID=3056739 RepID=UPI0023A0BDBB|nr:nuclear transport factor 2 family protein [Candidatus Palauibacter soopunensis]MDE2877440.1 nuclear transport factor 2 family protein [Candidatus Palauibacter soopunensis]
MLNVMHDSGRRSRRSPGRHAVFAFVIASALPVAPLAAQDDARDEVSATLDALHEAASEADFDRYFSLYAGEAVFLGTDATERWTREEFMDYTKARFDTGTGWTYHMLERHIAIAPGGGTAWFDERLENANLGETRGSGVLVMEEGAWKIAQYNLTIPIPNEMAREVAQRIRALTGG